MSSYTLTTTLNQPYDDAVEAVRAALDDQGFGVLTEIDLKATLKTKLDVDIEPEVILGACRPPLAYEAIQVEPSIAAVLPCNVVVRSVDEATTLVEAFDPDAMMGLADNDALRKVAGDAKQRLNAAFAALDKEN
ncbi:MAG: DUF302 domain-containing protein [Actinomycetota bacterium]|nr:DUF302 domain-containing protein [Actinomycetota bacterium]